jgi:Tol biopolymer transport system component/tRNA A-37 threonylcarbamoyl transferase component Bud32
MTSERWRMIEEIYHAAQARALGERAAFVGEACRGDGELKRQIEVLLAQDSGGGILDLPVSELLPDTLAMASSFGPYEIVSRIGKGGMAEVWKARDSRLNRDVAIKVSAEQFTDRFEREARAIAALNHSNICTLFDVGPNYLVMELVEGPTLAQRIGRGPIPLEEGLAIARQIARALEAAHNQGIVHRDLKPANIKIRPDGSVKVLDFGLAKSAIGEENGQTLPGTILGTPGYMAPEQARGEQVDKRADVWAFGVVLYEMVAGGRLFERDTTSDTLAAVIKEEPDWTRIPSRLQRVLRLCLEKDRNRRLRDISGVELLLDTEPAIAVAAPSRAQRAPRLGTREWMAIVGAGLLAGAGAMLLLGPRRHGIENYRYRPMEISREILSEASWAPDGNAFAYSAPVDGKAQAFVRYLNSSASAQITREAGGASAIGWSPDSKRVFVTGKNPGSDGAAVALFSVSVTGGKPEFVMPLDSLTQFGSSEAGISPDGKVLTVLRREGMGGVVSVATSSPIGSPLTRYSPAPFETSRISNRPHLKLSPDGSRLLYFLNNGQEQAWSLPFPPARGIPRLVLEGSPLYGGTPTFSWFPDGRHVVISLQQQLGDAKHLWIADIATGKRRALTTGLSNEAWPSVSPGGKQILFREVNVDYRVVSVSLRDASVRTLISSLRPAGMPAWARKPERFAYETDRNGEDEIWLHDGDGTERPLVTPTMFPPGTTVWWMNPSLSPEGDRLAYTRVAANGEVAIWLSSVAGGPPVRLTIASARWNIWRPGRRTVGGLRMSRPTVRLTR